MKCHLHQIPLIGNGDLDSAEKVVNALNGSNVDGVMIARACLGRPWLFSQAAAALRGETIPPEPTLDEQREVMINHYRLVVDRFGEEKGTVLMRKYACCYAQEREVLGIFAPMLPGLRAQPSFLRSLMSTFPKKIQL